MGDVSIKADADLITKAMKEIEEQEPELYAYLKQIADKADAESPPSEVGAKGLLDGAMKLFAPLAGGLSGMMTPSAGAPPANRYANPYDQTLSGPLNANAGSNPFAGLMGSLTGGGGSSGGSNPLTSFLGKFTGGGSSGGSSGGLMGSLSGLAGSLMGSGGSGGGSGFSSLGKLIGIMEAGGSIDTSPKTFEIEQ